MEVFKEIASVIGCILSCITLITLCSKGGRSLIASIFRHNTKDIQETNALQTEAIKELRESVDLLNTKIVTLDKRFEGVELVCRQQCRDTIKNIFYKYCHEKKIPLYERKTADATYEVYHNIFNGNSYATFLYNQICSWEIEVLVQDEIENEKWPEA